MRELFIPHEYAVILKELGFNEPCLADWTNRNGKSSSYYLYFGGIEYIEDGWYTNSMNVNPSSTSVTAPLYSQVFKWFRKNYHLYGSAHPIPFENGKFFEYSISDLDKCITQEGVYDSHEEAELECLKTLINMIKNA